MLLVLITVKLDFSLLVVTNDGDMKDDAAAITI